MSPLGLIEGILLAILAGCILGFRHRIANYITEVIVVHDRDRLTNRALVLKRKYRAARAAEDWPAAQAAQREYQRIVNQIKAIDRQK